MTRVWTKFGIVNHLAAAYGYRRYLELCTPNTGNQYAGADRSRLTCHRLLYRCPEGFDDGMPIDFRSVGLDIFECLAEIERQGLRFDIVFVDPWHLYETTARDLRAAFDLVVDGGTVVVHDCLPLRAEIATPEPSPIEWCGVTYQAYVDFVTTRDDLTYYTVDVDYGCGVIKKQRVDLAPEADTASVVRRWHTLGGDFNERFRFFQEYRQPLLGLKSAEEFLASERLLEPPLSSAR